MTIPTPPPSRTTHPTKRNEHVNEVPMPEQKTDDAANAPDELPHLATRFADQARPDHPPSERA